MPPRSPGSIGYVVLTTVLWLVGLPGALVVEADVGAIPWRSTVAVVAAAAVALVGWLLLDQGARRLAAHGIRVFGVAPGPRLVTDGIYGRIRHPIDVGTVALSLAPWIAVDLPLMWIVPAGALVWILGAVEPYEDRRLFEEFGDEFTAYRTRVARWLPRR